MKSNQCIFEETGYFWFREAMPESELKKFEEICSVSNQVGERIGWSKALADIFQPTSSIMRCAQEVMQMCRPVRLVAFNKTNSMNWSLPWHQDRVIAVKDKSNVDGYKHWSKKEGVWNCEPPMEILEKIMFARVHISDSDEKNGALKLAKNSHAFGYIPSQNAEDIAASSEIEVCSAKRGDIIFVKGLTLHKSEMSLSSSPRKAIRVDFTNSLLPSSLDWDFPMSAYNSPQPN